MSNKIEARRIEKEAAYPKRKKHNYIQTALMMLGGTAALLILDHSDYELLFGIEVLNKGVAAFMGFVIAVMFLNLYYELMTDRNVTVGDVGSVDSPSNCTGCDAPFKLTPYSKFRIDLECDGHSFEAVGYCGICMVEYGQS